MTHKELVIRAVRWLQNTLHCRVVLAELTAYTRSGETPDAIGWVNSRTILVEAKTSVSDFYADRKKRSRSAIGLGFPALGNWRFYFTPPGLLTEKSLPEGWGWYEVHGKQVRYAGGQKYANAKSGPFTSDAASEIAMLVSALGRQKI